MALGDAYATPAEYRAWVGAQDDESEASVQGALEAASRLLDHELGWEGTGFNQDAADEQRIYIPSPFQVVGYPTQVGVLAIIDTDPIVSVTSIEIDRNYDGTYGLTAAAGDYALLPRNAPLRPDPWPYRQIQMLAYGPSRGGTWIPGARYRVTGKFGWPAPPRGIKVATMELAAIIRVESPRALGRHNELQEVYRTSYQAQRIIDDLKETYTNPAVWL